MKDVAWSSRAVLALLLPAVCLCPVRGLAAVVGSTSVAVDATLVDKTQALTGRASVSTSTTGQLQVTIDWVDSFGRVADRQVSTLTLPGQTSVTFSFSAKVGLSMLNRVSVSAVFPATGNTLDRLDQDMFVQRGPQAGDLAVFDQDFVNDCLTNSQVGLVFQDMFHAKPVQQPIRLGPGGTNRRALTGVEPAELDAGGVDIFGHFAAQGINFLDQVAFSQAADSWIAGHGANGVGIDDANKGAAAHAGRS